ncbi:MAG: hypothetical protein ACP5G1_04100, partial [Nanopusillaceae archaeon]
MINKVFSRIELIVLITCITIPILYNFLVLHGQVDVFYSTTITQAESIIVHGHINYNDFNIQISLPNWFWQEAAYGYTSGFLVSPGIEVAILSMVTKLSPLTTLYIPAAYILMIFSLTLIIKDLVIDLDNSGNIYLKLMIYMIIIFYRTCTYTIGKFYNFEYHSYGIALYILIYYLIIKKIMINQIWFKNLIIIILLYISMMLAHYTQPYIIFGDSLGMAIMITLISLFKGYKDDSIKIITKNSWILVIIILSLLYLYNFYAYFVGGHISLASFYVKIIEYFVSKFTASGITQQVPLFVGSSYLQNVYSILNRFFTYINVFYIFIFILFIIFKKDRDNHLLRYLLLYSFEIGGSIMYFLAYFYVYGASFGFNDPWLIIIILFGILI